jgi:hypothetical protein
VIHRPALILATIILIVSCADGDDDACDGRLDLYSCENPDVDHLNAQGEPDPCHKDDDPCPGQCVPIPPAGWDAFPMLVWAGPELAPDCPADRAGAVVFEGFMDLVEPSPCPPCSCDPPTGECELPAVLTANEAPFCGVGVTEDILPLLPWEAGQCTPTTPVDGMSVTIGPLTMIEAGCKPSGPPPPRDGAMPGTTNVRACRGVANPPCLDPGLLCVPTAEPPPPGFSQCIFQRGEHACPATYPVQRLAFEGIDDNRYCSSCACEEPKHSTCTSMVSAFSVFTDADGCQQPEGSVMTNEVDTQCLSLAPGVVTNIQGILASPPVYEAGTCKPSGGEVIGEAELVGLSTFCCLETE